MSDTLDTQIDLWRAHMERRTAVSGADVDELEDHLRGHIESLTASGLSDDEAFLVAVKRLGSQDDIAREFARENSKRLWKQLVLGGEPEPTATRTGLGSWVTALVFALAGAIVVKVPSLLGTGLDDGLPFYARNLSLLGFAALTAYVLWRYRPGRMLTLATGVGFVTLAVLANMYPLGEDNHALVMTAIHVPIVTWLLAGLAYMGARWRHVDGRMDFVRFTGEWVIYLVLFQVGGMVLFGLIAAVSEAAGLDVGTFLAEWLIPCGAAGAVVIAAWLVEAKQSVVENMAPVLARVFTPLFAATFVVLLIAVLAAGDATALDRDLLIAFNAVLVVAIGLILYNLTARGDGEGPGWFDWLQLALVGGALALDIVALSNILARIADGWTFNRAVILGANVILLVNLAVSAWLLARLIRRRGGAVLALERWQAALLPVYGVWALAVVVVLPPLFGLT